MPASIFRNSNKRPRSQIYLPQLSSCVTGARAPTKRTSGMTRVSKSCTLVVEPYCFDLHSGSVWRIARETEERGSRRKGRREPPRRSRFYIPLNLLSIYRPITLDWMSLLYRHVTIVAETDLQLDNSMNSRFVINRATPGMKHLSCREYHGNITARENMYRI